MKALACGLCVDVRALDPSGEWVACRCGSVRGRWTDAQRGLAEFSGNFDAAFVLGMNNQYLMPALQGQTSVFQDARELHDAATDAPDHVFDKTRASCWAVLMKPGRSTDVVWGSA